MIYCKANLEKKSLGQSLCCFRGWLFSGVAAKYWSAVVMCYHQLYICIHFVQKTLKGEALLQLCEEKIFFRHHHRKEKFSRNVHFCSLCVIQVWLILSNSKLWTNKSLFLLLTGENKWCKRGQILQSIVKTLSLDKARMKCFKEQLLQPFILKVPCVFALSKNGKACFQPFFSTRRQN